MPQPFRATRYHSLAVVDGTVPDELEVTSRTQGGVIMGLRHREAPLFGVQFHPESVITEGGYRMLGNWLATVGLAEAAERAKDLSPLVKLSGSAAQPVAVGQRRPSTAAAASPGPATAPVTFCPVQLPSAIELHRQAVGRAARAGLRAVTAA